ncbi:MAG: biofilm regulation protein phosphatase SiaA [Desulfobacteraceae bacterium]
MNLFNFSLRTKSMLSLVVACLVALAPMVFIGWQVLERGKAYFGRAYAENFTLLNAQKIKEPVSRELALAQRFADSVLLRRWLKEPSSKGRLSSFFQEANGYQEAFQGGNYFVVNRETLAYYFNGPDKDYSQDPRYFLDPDKPDDSWFFSTIEDFDTHTINVNPDVHLGNVQVWIDVMIWNENRKIGMAGTGLELSSFLKEFIAVDKSGVTPMILDAKGLIQAHPDEGLIAYGSGAELDKQKASDQDPLSSLHKQLSGPDHAQRLDQAIENARENPEEVQTFWAGLNGRKQMIALTWIPELNWNVVTAVDLQAAQVLEGSWISMAVAALAVMLAILLSLFSYGVNRIVLQPLNRLHQSATALARGDYDVSLPPAGPDELGDLTRAFSAMVTEIKTHTRELEEKVRERTCDLEKKSTQLEEARDTAEAASQAKTEILDKVMESIHYARTIQQAILTREEQLRPLVPESFCIWKPKDVISGDMIWSRQHGDGFALAVLDCTGHGVPGGVMTMAAVSALDRVASTTGVDNPARMQQEVSRVVQRMLSNQKVSRFSEDGLDMGLCVYFHSKRRLVFAGSRLSLFYGCNEQLLEIKGDRQSLGYRSSDPDFPFQTHTIDLQEKMCFYLATDGLFDQIGQDTGLPLGKKRLRSFLSSLGGKPMQEQKRALLETFKTHQGNEEQRDDVTVLGFCPAP